MKIQECDNISQWISPLEASRWSDSIMILQDVICSEMSHYIKIIVDEVTMIRITVFKFTFTLISLISIYYLNEVWTGRMKSFTDVLFVFKSVLLVFFWGDFINWGLYASSSQHTTLLHYIKHKQPKLMNLDWTKHSSSWASTQSNVSFIWSN